MQGYDPKDAPQSWRELSKVPYAEIDMKGSPFYNETHMRFRKVCREFFWDEGIVKWCDAAENSGKYPPKVGRPLGSCREICVLSIPSPWSFFH